MNNLCRTLALPLAALSLALLAGCATPPAPYDYRAFIEARPATLLVLPPLNDSPDVKATPGVWAHATRPLAEAGYYVLPITLVDETFRQNGLQMAADVHEVPPKKLRDYFGADAAVYLRVKQYGSTYAVVASETRVAVEAKIIDLRSGQLLWEGKATASSAEQNQQNQGGLAGLLIAALVKQVMASATDSVLTWAAIADDRLLGAPRPNGVLPGPRAANAGQPPVPR
jgi:hypothetical protein